MFVCAASVTSWCSRRYSWRCLLSEWRSWATTVRPGSHCASHQRKSGKAVVVCPTGQSEPFTPSQAGLAVQGDTPATRHRRCCRGDGQTRGPHGRRTRRAYRRRGSSCGRHQEHQGLIRTLRPACLLLPRSNCPPAQSPRSLACCSCVVNSFLASTHLTPPRKSLPGRWFSGSPRSYSPTSSISRARPCSIVCAPPTALSTVVARLKTAVLIGPLYSPSHRRKLRRSESCPVNWIGGTTSK